MSVPGAIQPRHCGIVVGEPHARRARQFVIALLLSARAKVHSQELAQALAVSARTIVRDCAELELLGVPVQAERGAAGGVSLAPPIRLDPARFVVLPRARRGQRARLAAEMGATADALGTERLRMSVRRVIERLDGALRADAESALAQVERDALSADVGAAGDVLIALRRALWRGRQVRLVYPTDGEMHTRDVDPLVLLARDGLWYLSAYCHWRGDVRTFLVSHIALAQPLDGRVPVVQHAHLAGSEQAE